MARPAASTSIFRPRRRGWRGSVLGRAALLLVWAGGASWAAEPSLVERVDRVVRCIASGCTLEQLEASIEATREPAPEGNLALFAERLRATLRKPAPDAPVSELHLYPDAEARLCLEALVERFGSYEVVHVSKTSSVQFRLARDGAATSVYAWIREPPGTPCATVLSLRIRRTEVDEGDGSDRP